MAVKSSTDPPPPTKSSKQYTLFLYEAKEIKWDTYFNASQPNPFVEVYLSGKLIFKSQAQHHTYNPTWTDKVDFSANNPEETLLIQLRHDGSIRRDRPLIGSTEISIQRLVDLSIFSERPELDLFNGKHKTGIIVLALRKIMPPAPPSKPTEIPKSIPLEMRPDFKLPEHPSEPGKKMQMVGYQSQEISQDQSDKIVDQILARLSAGGEEDHS